MSSLRALSKGIAAFNLAMLVRMIRHGLCDLRPRLRAAYRAVDPFDTCAADAYHATTFPPPLPPVISSIQGRNSTGAVDKVAQLMLRLKYEELLRNKLPLPDLNDVEFQNFSQHREDGVLLYLFSLLGTTNRRCVEICAGDGVECNVANLIINHDWTGLLFDGSIDNVALAKAFYSGRKDGIEVYPPQVVQAWITAENINDLIRAQGFEGEIDLLSLDIDGIDYWLWDAINCIQPRVVVLEFNQGLGSTRAVTIPNLPKFVYNGNNPYYGGASLPAFIKLGRKKGYRLVGAERTGVNAFFVRNGVGDDVLPEVPISKCSVRGGPESDWLHKYEWVEV